MLLQAREGQGIPVQAIDSCHAGVTITPTYSWNASAGATTYTLQVATDVGFTAMVVNQSGIAATSYYPLVTLAYLTPYYWRVLAVNATGSTLATGAPRSFTTEPPPPGPFTLSAPADAAVGVAVLTTYFWNASSDATSYTLQVSTSNTFRNLVVDLQGIASTSATPSTLLAASTTCYWRVFAVNGAGLTAATAGPRSFTTEAAAGAPPGAFTLATPADLATGVSVTPTFTWNASANATSYRLQVAVDAGFLVVVADQAGIAGTMHTLTASLTSSAVHYWRVYGVNSLGTLLATGAPRSFTTTAPGAGPPGAFTMISPGHGTSGVPILPTFAWAASSGAQSYTLELATDSGFSSIVVNAPGLTAAVHTVAAPLAYSTPHYWRVAAVNGSGTTMATGAPRIFTTRPEPGTLDTSFRNTGIVLTPVGTGLDEAYAMALQPDGKIVVAGRSFSGTQTNFALARYLPNGSLDTSFSGDGLATAVVGSSDSAALTVGLQADGKIVAAGYVYTGPQYDFAVVRFNSNGTLDSTFDGDGRVTTAVGSGTAIVRAMAIQADGKIVVAGSSMVSSSPAWGLVRYATNGALDGTFGTGGIVQSPILAGGHPYGMALQDDGKIVVCGEVWGSTSSDFMIARYDSSGTLDTSFSGDGRVELHLSAGDFAEAVVIQPDGKIAVTGSLKEGNGVYFDIAMLRFDSGGTPDGTFDTDGAASTAIGPRDDVGEALALQADGRLVSAGWRAQASANKDFAVVRFTPAGALDTTFDVDGKFVAALGPGDDEAYAVALQPDGKILVAGFSSNGTNNDFAVIRIWP